MDERENVRDNSWPLRCEHDGARKGESGREREKLIERERQQLLADAPGPRLTEDIKERRKREKEGEDR